ncbi:MAG: hypothetical protein WCG26_11215 [Chloroflexales bacterium]
MSERLQRLREEIDQWRETRCKHGPMPGELWNEAALLARRLGVCPVSRSVGISYNSLQQRVSFADGNAQSVNNAMLSGGFVELSGAQLLGPAMAAGPVIELSDNSGIRLTVRLAPGSAVDIVRMVETFQRRQT